MLVRIVKNWTYPDLMRQTPSCSGVWGDVAFTLDPVEKCDALLVLNELSEHVVVNCPPDKVWAIFQEPYLPDFLPWMKQGHEQFARVYTNCQPKDDPRYILSPPLTPWHLAQSYDELSGTAGMIKNYRIAWVTSTVDVLPGHAKRNAFRKFLCGLNWPDLDLSGRGIRAIDDKGEALAPSRYGIAVENHFGNSYWTEKIADCWLADTLPFYYGCPDLEKYFPEKSFVRLNLDNFEEAALTIRRVVDGGEYEERLPAIREARSLVLNRYQFFPFMAKELLACHKSAPSAGIRLHPFRQGLAQRAWNHLKQVRQLSLARRVYPL